MKQSEQSKVWMIDALLSLLKTKEYSAITIKDITSKAGISRLTFYRNFESKEDIIRYHMERGFRKYMEELRTVPDLELRQMIALCFQNWEKHKVDIQMLTSQNLGWLLREPFETFLQAVLKQMELEEKYTYFQIQFLIGGMFSDMLAWLNDTQGRKPDDIAQEIMAIIQKS